MRRAAPVIALLASAALLAGCGGQGSENTDSTKDFTGEQQAVATTVEELQKSAREKDGTKVCADLITAELRDDISATNCQKVVKDAIRETDEVDLIVTAVTIDGTTAVAQVKEKTGEDASRTRTVKLEKVAGKWRVSELPAPQA
jgi:hypothetical protein